MVIAQKIYLSQPEIHSVTALMDNFNEVWLHQQLSSFNVPEDFLTHGCLEYHVERLFRRYRTLREVTWKSVDVKDAAHIRDLGPEFPTKSRFDSFSRTVIRVFHVLRLQKNNIGLTILNDEGNANIFHCHGCPTYINFFCDNGEWTVDASEDSVKYCNVGDRFFFPA